MARKPAYGPSWAPPPANRTHPPVPPRTGSWFDAAREQKKPFDTVRFLADETKNATVGQPGVRYEEGI